MYVMEKRPPQFHVIYDNYFETDHTTDDEVPTFWPGMMMFEMFRSDYDYE